MLLSSSCRVTRRESCSQATSRPCRSRVNPLARLVGSSSSDTPLPGSYFMRRLLWMSLKTRWPLSRHHSGPSAGPCGPPNPSARSWIGCEVAMIRSNSGASCSIRFDDCATAIPPLAKTSCERPQQTVRLATNDGNPGGAEAGRCRAHLPSCRVGPLPRRTQMPTRTLGVVSLGGGNAGMGVTVATREAGLTVAMIEPDLLGGTCPNRGCMPKKVLVAAAHALDEIERAKAHHITVGKPSLDWAALIDREKAIIAGIPASLEELMKRRGVEVIREHGRFAGPNAIAVGAETLEAKQIMVAP